MAAQLGNDPIQVGAILRDTRKREGIDIDTVEQRTKIRVKYLRALEEEDWEVLPGPAYARGFIRAYADLLGLDSEVLVDEFRRRYEQPSTSTYELGEPVLRERDLIDARRRPLRRRWVIAAIVAEILILVLVIGLVTGGDGDDEGPTEKAGKGGRQERGGKRQAAGAGSGKERDASDSGTVTVRLVARSDLQACVVDDDGRVLVPDQVITAGAADGPYTSKRFRLELDPATARIFVNGERTSTSPSAEPAAYRVTPDGVRPATFTGGLCP